MSRSRRADGTCRTQSMVRIVDKAESVAKNAGVLAVMRTRSSTARGSQTSLLYSGGDVDCGGGNLRYLPINLPILCCNQMLYNTIVCMKPLGPMISRAQVVYLALWQVLQTLAMQMPLEKIARRVWPVSMWGSIHANCFIIVGTKYARSARNNGGRVVQSVSCVLEYCVLLSFGDR